MELLCVLTPGAGPPCRFVRATRKVASKTLIGSRTHCVWCQNIVPTNSSLSGSTQSFSVLEAHPHKRTTPAHRCQLMWTFSSISFSFIFSSTKILISTIFAIQYVTNKNTVGFAVNWQSAPWRVCLCDAKKKGASNSDGLHVALKTRPHKDAVISLPRHDLMQCTSLHSLPRGNNSSIRGAVLACVCLSCQKCVFRCWTHWKVSAGCRKASVALKKRIFFPFKLKCWTLNSSWICVTHHWLIY